MKVTWFGESGFCLESQGKKLLLDPYFSDALGKQRDDMHRLSPVKDEWLADRYDYLLFTHCHIDHTDPETVEALQCRCPGLIMAGPRSSMALLPFANVYFELTAGAEAMLNPFRVTAVPAVHSDRYALGYKVEAEEKVLYFSGDTALLCGLQDRAPHAPDIAFLCFNAGIGKNMDEKDAVRLASAISPRLVVPFHYGILPGGPTPDLFCRLLSEVGVPWFIPTCGETYNVKDMFINEHNLSQRRP